MVTEAARTTVLWLRGADSVPSAGDSRDDPAHRAWLRRVVLVGALLAGAWVLLAVVGATARAADLPDRPLLLLLTADHQPGTIGRLHWNAVVADSSAADTTATASSEPPEQ